MAETKCILFLFNHSKADTLQTLGSVACSGSIDQVVVFEPTSLAEEESVEGCAPAGVNVVSTAETGFSTEILKQCESYDCDYKMIYTKSSPLSLGYRCVERMVSAAEAWRGYPVLVYADYYETIGGTTRQHPVVDYQVGSVRNDFDFGSLMLFSNIATKGDLKYAALYYAQLMADEKIHVPEFLYTEEESDVRKSGEKQFDYVNPAMREVQIEMERAFTMWLSDCELRIDSDMIKNADLDVDFPTEASVIIPVRNRVKTVGDAIRSVLSQEASFKFNVIVADNHSTDGTSEVIEALAAEDDRVIHLTPERTDLGIGGCWDMAVRSEHCGKFAVQLDSDDLYSGPDTLQRVVDKFYETKAAMVIGSYSLVDFNLQPLPPGLIDHKEWTDENGMNNALRINGLGAPRAFFVPVLREIGFPNTSYGEDYAVGLAISGQYKIGRIYDNLYLCRRWDGNSDAALSIDKVNRNNLYKDWIRSQEMLKREQRMREDFEHEELEGFYATQMEGWPEVKQRFDDLGDKVVTKSFSVGNGVTLEAQFNPARIASTGAKVDKESIKKRKCFLCEDNQPKEQLHLHFYGKYQICINPYPILHKHYTIPLMAHKPQVLGERIYDIEELLEYMPGMVVFYNGAQCGASAPDHFHFQAGMEGQMPLQRDIDKYLATAQDVAEGIKFVTGFAYPLFVAKDAETAKTVIDALPKVDDEAEARFNLIAWNGHFVIIPRKKLRPDCYFAEGEENYCISPGAVDMAGLIITPKEKDFQRLTVGKVVDILREVTLTEEELQPVIQKLRK